MTLKKNQKKKTNKQTKQIFVQRNFIWFFFLIIQLEIILFKKILNQREIYITTRLHGIFY